MTTLRNRIKTRAYRWYYRRMNRLAWEGAPDERVDNTEAEVGIRPEAVILAMAVVGMVEVGVGKVGSVE